MTWQGASLRRTKFIVERTGVRTNYHVEPEQAVSALMVPAARQAIEAAGLLPEDIDLLLVNTRR